MILLWAKACDTISERMIEIARGRATRAESVKTLRHIGQCDECRRDWEELQDALGLIAEIRDWGEISPRTAFHTNVTAQVQRASQRRKAVADATRGEMPAAPRKRSRLPAIAAAVVAVAIVAGAGTWWAMRPRKEAGGAWMPVLSESFAGPGLASGWRRIGALELQARGRLEVLGDPSGEYGGGGAMVSEPIRFGTPTEIRAEVEVGTRGPDGGAAIFLTPDDRVGPTGRARDEVSWWTEGANQYLSSPKGEILWKSRGTVRPGEYLRIEMLVDGRTFALRVNGREEFRGPIELNSDGGLYLGLRAASGGESGGAQAGEAPRAAAGGGVAAAFGNIAVRRRAAK